MRHIGDIAREIVAREGGYVDDPADPGGATNRGVTLGTLRQLGCDLDGDGDVDRGDLRRVSPEKAAGIFIEHYYAAPRIDELPEALQPSVFDMYVNAGRNAVRILQRLMGRMRIDCAVDGVIGPETIAAAERAQAAAPDHFSDAYGIARRDYYYDLADRRPALRKFARRRDGGKGGWIRRAESFIAPRYHLSDAAHRERTSQWD